MTFAKLATLAAAQASDSPPLQAAQDRTEKRRSRRRDPAGAQLVTDFFGQVDRRKSNMMTNKLLCDSLDIEQDHMQRLIFPKIGLHQVRKVQCKRALAASVSTSHIGAPALGLFFSTESPDLFGQKIPHRSHQILEQTGGNHKF